MHLILKDSADEKYEDAILSIPTGAGKFMNDRDTTSYFYVDSVELKDGRKYTIGTKIEWDDPDHEMTEQEYKAYRETGEMPNVTFAGAIDEIFIMKDGDIEVSISAPLGRLPLKECQIVK